MKRSATPRISSLKKPLLAHLYRWLFPLALPIFFLRLLWRSRKNPAYRQRWGERMGYVPFSPPQKPILWIHAVSLGESIAITPFIRRCLTEFPDLAILVTNTTITGSAQIQNTFGEKVLNSYLPYDTPGCLHRFLKRLEVPVRALVVAETELWPCLYETCANKNMPIVIINARISNRSLQGYNRILPLTRWILSKVTRVTAQSQEDGQRFVHLGLPSDRLLVSGNIKFDANLKSYPNDVIQSVREQLNPDGQSILFIAASTHNGEEELILDAFVKAKIQIPNLRLILVPRHPERFDTVAELLTQRGFSFVRRQSGQACLPDTQVYLGDTMGELALLYQLSNIAFVGGSWAPIGGHNTLEPTMAGLPVFSGPNTQNFQEITALLTQAGILQIVDSPQTLSQALVACLSDPKKMADIQESAKKIIAQNQGATEKTVACVKAVF